MYEVRKMKEAVERWVGNQNPPPTRKQTARHFPDIPQKLIRGVLQASRDQERSSSEKPSEDAGVAP